MTFDKSKPQGKCIDVNGDNAIFKRLASLAYETGSKASDPCEAMLTYFGNGVEIFEDLLEVHDGWQFALVEEKAVITCERDYTWSVCGGPKQSKKIKAIDLNLNLGLKVIRGDSVREMDEPLATERNTRELIEFLWERRKKPRGPPATSSMCLAVSNTCRSC